MTDVAPEAAILRDVVGIDADRVLALGQYGTRSRVAHDGAVASRPGITA
jgi:hypothetical protein